MTSPTITTVIPTYRRPRLLRRALDSVVTQTYPHYKVLVCDNASGDETADVVAEFSRRDPRVVYHCQPENLGAIANMRFGMSAVETEYFSLLCDDDLLLPGFYEGAIAGFSRHPEAKFFCGQAVYYHEATGTHGVRPRRHWQPGLHEPGRWVPRMMDLFFTVTACVFSSDVRDRIGPMEPMHMADVVLLLRAAASFPFVVALTPCAILVYTGRNTTTLLSGEELDRCYEIMKRSCEDLDNLDEGEREEVESLLEKHFRVVANGMLRTALEAGDGRRYDEIAAFAIRRGGLDWRRRLRIAMARGREGTSVRFRLVRGFTALGTRYKRMRRGRWKGSSLEEVVALYSGDQAAGEDHSSRPHPRLA